MECAQLQNNENTSHYDLTIHIHHYPTSYSWFVLINIYYICLFLNWCCCVLIQLQQVNYFLEKTPLNLSSILFFCISKFAKGRGGIKRFVALLIFGLLQSLLDLLLLLLYQLHLVYHLHLHLYMPTDFPIS